MFFQNLIGTPRKDVFTNETICLYTFMLVLNIFTERDLLFPRSLKYGIESTLCLKTFSVAHGAYSVT